MEIKTHSIYYSSIKKGTSVYLVSNEALVELKLTQDKRWNDNVFAAVVVRSDSDSIEEGTYNPDWCADVFFTFKDHPCDDKVLEAN